MKNNIIKLYCILRRNTFFEFFIKKILMLEKNYREKQQVAKHQLYEKLNLKTPVILAGPFKGIKYYSKERAISALNKLIGTYELELVPIINTVLKKKYELIIDVGAAEGYYVIGFAKKYPKIKVIAYDNDPAVR